MQVLRVERRCRLLEMTTTAWICIDIDARVDLYVISRKVGINELKYVGEGDNQDKQWTSKGIYRYEVEKEDVPVEYSTFKCVVVDSTGKGTEALQEIINRDFIYQFSI